MTNRHPYPHTDLQEVISRHHIARRLITTFARSASALDDIWQHVTAALDDAPALVTEVIRLRAELVTIRRHRANLIAASRATLAAHHDGERDPLFYLRDELDAQHLADSAHSGDAR
ncbi:hypothetical protein [Nonomuraea roseoviolacea]|uniref:Uncharacterized protein n=1 Tax=Nonomuraea roseoviolacea subsp. carminata TaxID=160689 RepID=A0ABT1JU63_9ACTN|nr:hypothetical protein [Nonomuraea roseoviolacea]MCP2345130.1 hypothetical protein [Nonomuraea roseoviolacea subsp. carminata]